MMVRVLLTCCLLCGHTLFGAIEKYLKPITDVSEGHSFKNIQFICTINLDKRPEKFASCTKQLHPYGIFPYRFSAVNGWELSRDVLSELGMPYRPGMTPGVLGTVYPKEVKRDPYDEKIHIPNRRYFSHKMARGTIGIVLSHMSILKYALDKGYETIWVMEDDIQLCQDPTILPDLIDKLDRLVGKEGWDVLFTDLDTKNHKGEYVPCTGYAIRPNFTPEHPERFAMRKPVGKDFQQIGARYGAYSMIMRRSGMQKIYSFIDRYSVFFPYDMEYYLPNDIRLFTVLKDVVSTQIKAPSDNGEPRYGR